MGFESDNNFGLSLRNDESSAPSATGLYLMLSDLVADPAGLSDRILATPQDQLAGAIASEKNITQRKRFIQRSADVASPKALLALAEAAAHAYGRPFSKPMTSLLNKLTREAVDLAPPQRALADQAYRALVKEIAETWSLGSLDTSATSFESLFQQDSQKDAHHSSAGTAAPEPDRVIQMSFETGALGSLVWTAVAQLGEGDGVRRLLEMLKKIPPGSRAADAVGQQFANPVRVALLLQEDPVDFAVIDTLLPRMGESASNALLDGIADSKNRDTRRGLLQRIVKLGPTITPLVIDRLRKDERWFVQRNMLAILRDLKASTSQIPIEKYLTHSDPRVRREAMQLQFADPAQRDRALLNALRETDSQIVKIALQACRHGMPEAAVPILAKRVVEADFPAEFRPAALHLIGRSNNILALEALLRFGMGGTTLFGKPKLADKSPEMLIALSGLARSWPNDRRAGPLLATARESKDREIAAAAQIPTRGTATTDSKAFDALG
jgi:hypothetical protein